MGDIENEVLTILSRSLDRKVTPEERIDEDLQIDSLGKIELAMEFEDQFQVVFEADDFEQEKTVADLIAIVKGKLQ